MLTEDRWVTSAKEFQNPGGHHTSLLYQTTNLREPGDVWECSEADMIATSYLAGGNAVYDPDDP